MGRRALGRAQFVWLMGVGAAQVWERRWPLGLAPEHFGGRARGPIAQEAGHGTRQHTSQGRVDQPSVWWEWQNVVCVWFTVPLRRGCARTKLLSYGIATVQDGTLERMDVSGAPGVRWEEREKLEDAVTASSRRMRDMLCVQGRGKRKSGIGSEKLVLKTYYRNSVISSASCRSS